MFDKITTRITIEDIHEDGTRTPIGPDLQNDICWPTWRFLMANTSSDSLGFPTRRDALSSPTAPLDTRWYIAWGATDVYQTPLNAWYPVDGTSYVDDLTPSWTDGVLPTDPDMITFTATIPAPTVSSRTIRGLGLFLRDPSAVSDVCAETNGLFTLLRLDPACVQPVGQVRAVTYRLYLPKAANMPNPRVSRMIYEDIRSLLRSLCIAVNSIHVSVNSLANGLSSTSYDLDSIVGSVAYRSVPSAINGSMHELTDGGIIDSDPAHTVYSNSDVITKSYAASSVPINGCFIRNIVLGGLGYASPSGQVIATPGLYNPALPDLSSPLQNVYAQRNSPPGPFQDLTVANTATMTGKLTLGTGSYVDPKYQKMMKVLITSSGTVGVATYKVAVMKFTGGFAGNTWLPRTSLLPQSLTGTNYIRKASDEQSPYESYINFGGVTYRSPDNNVLAAAIDCQRNTTGVSIYNVLTGRKHSFNSLSTPQLPVTAVADGDVSNGYTYVACANTGLWRISPNLSVVEQVPAPSPCTNAAYQVCVKTDGTLFVLFNGGLAKLSNPGAALGSLSWTVYNPASGTPFTYTGITDNNWDKVCAMSIDPDHVEDRLLLLTSVVADTTGNFRKGFVWYSTTTGTAVNPTTGGIAFTGFTWTQANLLKISDAIRCIDGRWAAPVSTTTGDSRNVVHFAFGANDLGAAYFQSSDTSAYWRPVAATINGRKGFLMSITDTGSSTRTSLFILASILPTVPVAHTLTGTSGYADFWLRSGATSYHATIETVTNVTTGVLARPVLYIAGSNMFLSYEASPNVYGVTPFVLPPTHSKYATYEAAFWKTYGYDGANWVLNHAGSRTTHSGAQTLPDMDGMTIAFTNGVSGTSFVANEWFITAVGMGLMKDNGTTYDFTFSYDISPVTRVALTGSVPLTALGALTDEPVTFSPLEPDLSAGQSQRRLIQNKGIVLSHCNFQANTLARRTFISDQLIQASGNFDFRFKWISYVGGTGTYKRCGMASGTGTYTYGVHFRYNPVSGALEVYNNTTLLGSVAAANLDITKECRIARTGGNTITAYYDGVQVGASVTSSSALVIMIQGDVVDSTNKETGWYGMKISYTEARRVMRVGDSGTFTGSYAPNFSALTYSSLAGDAKVYLGSPVPLAATLDYTTSGVAISGTGIVKVAPGAGWLIFHDSEPANVVSGFVHAHHVLNNY